MTMASSLKPLAICLVILSAILFPLLYPPHSPPRRRHLLSTSSSSSSPPPPPISGCSAVSTLPPPSRCAAALSLCAADSPGLFNYAALHFCSPISGRRALSLPSLFLLLCLQFSFLSLSAGSHFSPAVARLSSRLRLSPSMAAVTLLALGNGAPDAFSSAAALRGGIPRAGLAAILSAGAFVSAFVVGCVAIHAAPFALDPAPFVRDIFFYLIAASALFYVYLSAEIYLWQALGFVGMYLFFVALVFWMDLGTQRSGNTRTQNVDLDAVENGIRDSKVSGSTDYVPGKVAGDAEDVKHGWSPWSMLGKITQVMEIPVAVLLKLTIPSTTPTDWSRFYASANIALCPVFLLYSFSSHIPLDYQIVFLIPASKFPIWSVVLVVSFSLAIAHFFLETEPPDSEHILTTVVAFIMSVLWISTMAGELLNTLAALGTIMNLSPAILGLTVLAWGNSVGDLVADVALAKAGQPVTAMAGCFAGPMFNMLVGLGLALVIETGKVYPDPYELRFHINILVAFVFLLLSLMGTLLVVTWHRFRVTKCWGFCLVGLYTSFTVVSLVLAKFS